jgi:hypothetical protein
LSTAERTFSIHLAVTLYLGILSPKTTCSTEEIKSCGKLRFEKRKCAWREIPPFVHGFKRGH